MRSDQLDRCSGTNARGEPCGNRPLDGSEFCRAHTPLVDDAIFEQFLSMLRAGDYLDVAARAAGVDVGPLLDRDVYRTAIDRAVAQGETANVARIAAAARDNWQAAAWLLERQYPERWGRPASREPEKPAPPVTGPDGLDELAGKRDARRAAAKP